MVQYLVSLTVYACSSTYSMQLFLSCSILSLCFWGYFYSICLMHIVVNNDILQRVLRSVTKNGVLLLPNTFVCAVCYAMHAYNKVICVSSRTLIKYTYVSQLNQ